MLRHKGHPCNSGCACQPHKKHAHPQMLGPPTASARYSPTLPRHYHSVSIVATTTRQPARISAAPGRACSVLCTMTPTSSCPSKWALAGSAILLAPRALDAQLFALRHLRVARRLPKAKAAGAAQGRLCGAARSRTPERERRGARRRAKGRRLPRRGPKALESRARMRRAERAGRRLRLRGRAKGAVRPAEAACDAGSPLRRALALLQACLHATSADCILHAAQHRHRLGRAR